jgi:hypothetical protein
MAIFSFVVIASIVIGFIYLYNGGLKDSEKLKSAIQLTYTNNNLSPTKEHFSPDLREGIVYDQEINTIIFLKRKEFTFDYDVQLVSAQDILQSKIIENGEMVTQSSRSSQLTGIALGSLLAGGVGAIIGGLSGKTLSNKVINEIQLELVLDDVLEPLTRMRFFYSASGLKQSSDRYREEYNKVYYWHKLIEVLMHQNKSQTM